MTNSPDEVRTELPAEPTVQERTAAAPAGQFTPGEIGGREGPDPTRFGDWELRGRCIDF